MSKIRIAIIGHGFVGQAVDYGFTHADVLKTIIDPKYGTTVEDLNNSTYHHYYFVCVPTPMGENGAIDYSILDDVMDKLAFTQAELDPPTIIIKSTVTPNIIDRWYYWPNVVYNPEFLTERSAKADFIKPDFHVFGGYQSHCEHVKNLYAQYSLCQPCPVYTMSLVEASYVKYAINTFLSTKVTFFNQLFDSVTSAGGRYNIVANAVGADPRIGYSHTRVPGFDGKQGFGGACFPKDCAAFANYDKSLTLLDKVITINNDYRSQYELDEREKAQNVNYEQAKKEQ